MDWLAKLKEQAHTISGLFGLIVLLSLIVWRAVPASVWDKVSEVTPKRALWALLALEAIALILETAYIILLRRERKLKLDWHFGVQWSRKLLPHCPVCSTPLANYGQHAIFTSASVTWGFICPRCKDFFPMTDDEGSVLELKEAKQRLMSTAQKQIDGYVIDEVREKILVRLAQPNSEATFEILTRHLGLHEQRVEHYLTEMEEKGYIYHASGPLGFPIPITYHIAPKGRDFLMSKNLI